jgi:hypothetical protein
MNSELVKCTRIIIWSNDYWLMHLLSQNVMDHLINFMNGNHSSPLPLFHFPLITNPITSHIHLSLPVLRLITVKRIYVLKWMKVAVSWVDCSEVLLVFFIVHCCCH